MSAALKDWYDLLRELHQHPEWREELRRLVLTEELLSLPEAFRQLQLAVEKLAATVERLGQRVDELAEAQKRTDERVAELAEAQKRTDERVAELAEAQKRTDQKLAELTEAQKRTDQKVAELAEAQKRTEQKVAELTEAQKRTDQKVAELAEAQKRTEQKVAELAEAQKRTDQRVTSLGETVARLAASQRELAEAQRRTERNVENLATALATLTGQVDQLRGWSLEYRYQRHTPAYLGPLLRRIHTLSPEELATLVEDAEDRGLLDSKEATGLIQADVVCTGRLQKDRDQKVWAVVEVSWVIGEEDVKRAAERAASLRKIVAEPVIPVVAGNHIGDRTAALASSSKVYVLIGSAVTAPEEDPKTPLAAAP